MLLRASGDRNNENYNLDSVTSEGIADAGVNNGAFPILVICPNSRSGRGGGERDGGCTWEHLVAGGVERVELQDDAVVGRAADSRTALGPLLNTDQRLVRFQVVDCVRVRLLDAVVEHLDMLLDGELVDAPEDVRGLRVDEGNGVSHGSSGRLRAGQSYLHPLRL